MYHYNIAILLVYYEFINALTDRTTSYILRESVRINRDLFVQVSTKTTIYSYVRGTY